MKLRARWTGAAPRPGDYLASSTRPRFAYRVVAVDVVGNRVGWDAEGKTEVRRLVIEVDRVPIGRVPAKGRVHPWRWDRRGPRVAR